MIVKGNDMAMIRGDSESITVSIADSSDEEYLLVDGDIIYFTVKRQTNTNKKALQKIVTNFPDNTAIIEILPEDTKHLDFFDYVYDIQLTEKNGTVKTVIPPSKFSVLDEVTYE